MSSSLPPYEPQPSYLRSLMHDYHQQINAQTDATVADLQQRWIAARAAINADIARLEQQMETAIANGDSITYAWLADAQRLAALKASVEGNIAQFADGVRQLVADGQLSALDLGTNAAQETLAATVPPGLSYTFGVPPADVLHAQAGALSPSSPLTALFAQLGPDAAASAQAALFTSVALGEGPRAAATRLFWNTNLPRQRAEVIARTEILRSWRGAQMENYRANSDVVSGWQWSADFSDRTCGACIAMDGTIHTLDEDLDDHIMGRCSALPITKPWSDILAGTGADTSGLTETSIASWDSYLHGNGTAADWFDGLAPEVQNSILGPAKAEAYRAGDITLQDLAGVRRDALWGDSIQEVSLKQLGLDAQEYLATARANGTDSVVADAEALAQAQAGTPAAQAGALTESMAGQAAGETATAVTDATITTVTDPPFTPEQFAAADLKPLSRDIRGANDAWTATIDGQKYLIKDVASNASSTAIAVSRAQAEMASSQIAQALGMGDRVTPTWAFTTADGRTFVVSQWLEDTKSLANARGAFIRNVSEENIRDIVLQEYIVKDTDRNMGNYLFDPRTGQAYTIDHSDALQISGADPEAKASIVRVWQAQQEGVTWADTLYGDNGYDQMTFDTAQLDAILMHEADVIAIMRANGLDASIVSVERRFQALRDLSQLDNPTYQDLVTIGRRISWESQE